MTDTIEVRYCETYDPETRTCSCDVPLTVHYLVAVQEEDGIVDAPLCGAQDIDAHLTPSMALVSCPDCKRELVNAWTHGPSLKGHI